MTRPGPGPAVAAKHRRLAFVVGAASALTLVVLLVLFAAGYADSGRVPAGPAGTGSVVVALLRRRYVKTWAMRLAGAAIAGAAATALAIRASRGERR